MVISSDPGVYLPEISGLIHSKAGSQPGISFIIVAWTWLAGLQWPPAKLKSLNSRAHILTQIFFFMPFHLSHFWPLAPESSLVDVLDFFVLILGFTHRPTVRPTPKSNWTGPNKYLFHFRLINNSNPWSRDSVYGLLSVILILIWIDRSVGRLVSRSQTDRSVLIEFETEKNVWLDFRRGRSVRPFVRRLNRSVINIL